MLDASVAFIGETRQLTANPGGSISVDGASLIGSVNAASYQWAQISGASVQLTQPTSETLAFTLPQVNTPGATGSTGTTGTTGSTSSTVGTSSYRKPLSTNSYRMRQWGRFHFHAKHVSSKTNSQLVFEMIAKDSNDEAYIAEVVIRVVPASSTGSGNNGGATSSGGGTTTGGGTTDTSGSTGLSNPVCGSPLATDPNTGAYIDPATGQDMANDQATGLPIDPTTQDDVDPDTGYLIDPTTGQETTTCSTSSGGTGSGGTVSTDPGSSSSGSGAPPSGYGSSGGTIDGSVSAA